jgi:hypothetical protein
VDRRPTDPGTCCDVDGPELEVAITQQIETGARDLPAHSLAPATGTDSLRDRAIGLH